MFGKNSGVTTLDIEGRLIEVEVDVASGLPRADIVGLSDTVIKETKEMVRTAIRNSGLKLLSRGSR